MEGVIYLVIAVVIAVVAIRLGMIAAPLVGRLSRLGEVDDPEGGADAPEPDTTDVTDPDETTGADDPDERPSNEEPR